MPRDVWIAVMSTDPSNFKPTAPEAIRCPVTRISYTMAKDFISAAGLKLPFTFRLPSEAEWEWAARAGQEYEYSGSDDIAAVAWYVTNSYVALDANHVAKQRQPSPVGTKQPNAFGVYDMSGNASEWVNDYYSATAPYGTDPVGPEYESHLRRVLKGGSYLSTAARATVYYRTYNPESTEGSEQSFRLAI